MKTSENTTMGKVMQVMAHVDAVDRDSRGQTVKCNEMARFYGKGDRFFESTCYVLVRKNWLSPNMGRHGGYGLGKSARKRGPIGLIKDFCSDDDAWILELLLKRSPKSFAEFREELKGVSPS